MQSATSTGCQVLNVHEPAIYGCVCEDEPTRIVMQNGPRRVCWTHALASDAGRVLSFADAEPAIAEAANG